MSRSFAPFVRWTRDLSVGIRLGTDCELAIVLPFCVVGMETGGKATVREAVTILLLLPLALPLLLFAWTVWRPLGLHCWLKRYARKKKHSPTDDAGGAA